MAKYHWWLCDYVRYISRERERERKRERCIGIESRIAPKQMLANSQVFLLAEKAW